MASERIIKICEKLLGKPLPPSASTSDDSTLAELILMEFSPRLNTGDWSGEKLLGAFELLAHQQEIEQQQNADSSEVEDFQLLAKVKSDCADNWKKPLSSNRKNYV